MNDFFCFVRVSDARLSELGQCHTELVTIGKTLFRPFLEHFHDDVAQRGRALWIDERGMIGHDIEMALV